MEKETTTQSYEIQQLVDTGITISQLPKLIEQMYNANQNLFIWGFMGLGKTQTIEQFVAKKRKTNPNFGYVYLPLASMLPEDLTGTPMPYKDENGMNRTAYAIPKMLPVDPDSEGVIVCDEFNNSLPSVQNACQQMIQERRIGDYIVPKGWWIVAMGNQTGVNAYSNEIQAPVKDRFAHIYLKPSSDNWVDYILGLETTQENDSPFFNEMTPSQIKTLTAGFIKTHPELLLDEQEYNRNSYTFATPRSWERFIKLYSANLNATKSEFKRFANMYLGKEIANLLADYFENSSRYQDPTEILIDGKPFRENKDLASFMGTLVGCISQVAQADKDIRKQQLDNLFNAGFKLPSVDWQVILAKMVKNKSVLKPYIDAQHYIKIAMLVNEKQEQNL